MEAIKSSLNQWWPVVVVSAVLTIWLMWKNKQEAPKKDEPKEETPQVTATELTENAVKSVDSKKKIN